MLITNAARSQSLVVPDHTHAHELSHQQRLALPVVFIPGLASRRKVLALTHAAVVVVAAPLRRRASEPARRVAEPEYAHLLARAERDREPNETCRRCPWVDPPIVVSAVRVQLQKAVYEHRVQHRG